MLAVFERLQSLVHAEHDHPTRSSVYTGEVRIRVESVSLYWRAENPHPHPFGREGAIIQRCVLQIPKQVGQKRGIYGCWLPVTP